MKPIVRYDIQIWDDIDHEWTCWEDVTGRTDDKNNTFLETYVNEYFEEHQGDNGADRKIKFRLVKITVEEDELATKTVQIEKGKRK